MIWNVYCCTPAAPPAPSAASIPCGARASSRWRFGTTPTSTPGRSIRPGGTACWRMPPPSAWRSGCRRTTACGSSWNMWRRTSTAAASTATSTGWRARPNTRRSTAFPPSPPPCWPAPIRTTRPLPPPGRSTPGSTGWNSSTGTSGPISGPGTSGPGSWASTCRSTAAASFPRPTAIRSRSTGTGRNSRRRGGPAGLTLDPAQRSEEGPRG